MFLVCGEALFDLFLSESDGPAKLGFDARAGGSPFNVAIGLARQGAAAALLTGVSEDMLGRRLVRVLEDEGVSTRYLVRSGRRTTLSLVDLTTDGAPAYAFYGLGSADCAVTSQDLPEIDESIKALHFGSYSIAVAPVADAFQALAHKERDRFISLDPNVRPTVVADMDVWRRRIDTLLPVTDVVKVSAEDLSMLFPGANAADIASKWLAQGPSLIVVTDGGASVTAFTPSARVSVVPPAIEVVDTVGAGDAFQAAFLADLAELGALGAELRALSDATLGELLTRASQVAAVNCTRTGADIPRRGDQLGV